MIENLGSPYFLLLSIGFAAGFWWSVSWGEKLGVARLALIDACIAALVGGLAGARLLHVAVEPLPAHVLSAAEIAELEALAKGLDAEGRRAVEDATRRPLVRAPWLFIARMPPGELRTRAVDVARRRPAEVPARLWYGSRPSEIVRFWNGGLAYFGGLVAAVVLGLLVVHRHRAPLLDVTDAASPGIVLGLVFGRLGCFLGGCCYGAVCEPAWWSSQPAWYPSPPGGVPRYPTALLMAALALLLFLALRFLIRRRAFRGEVFLAMLVLYAPGRFLVEAIRADPRGGAAGLSTTQIAVLATGLPALVAWVLLRRRASAPAGPGANAA